MCVGGGGVCVWVGSMCVCGGAVCVCDVEVECVCVGMCVWRWHVWGGFCRRLGLGGGCREACRTALPPSHLPAFAWVVPPTWNVTVPRDARGVACPSCRGTSTPSSVLLRIWVPHARPRLGQMGPGSKPSSSPCMCSVELRVSSPLCRLSP